jgi:sarcosine oxidase delta subunit
MPIVTSEFGDHVKDVDDDMPVHLYMYEQYASGCPTCLENGATSAHDTGCRRFLPYSRNTSADPHF